MKKKLISLFEELRDKAYNQARNEINKLDKLIQATKSYNVPVSYISEAKEKLDEMKTLLKRKSYFGSLKALRMAKDTQKIVLNLSIETLRNEISETENDLKKLTYQSSSEIIPGLFFIVTTVGAIILSYFIGQFLGSFISLGFLFWPAIIFVFIIFWIMICFGGFYILENYRSPKQKNLEKYLNTLKKNLLDCQQLFGSINLDKKENEDYSNSMIWK